MSNSPQIARSILGQQLRKFRKRAGIGVAEACRETGISESKLRKLENGTNDAVKLPDIYACGTVYGCSSYEVSHLKDLALGADQAGWYHPYDVPTEFAHFIELEGAARTIHINEMEVVTGLFQIPEYIEALRASATDQEQAVDSSFRTLRQRRVLDSVDPPEVTYVTSESTLRRQVGGREVAQAQLRHLVVMAERPNISIHVVPFAAGDYPAMISPFIVFQFDSEFPSVVYMEYGYGSRYEEGECVNYQLDVLKRTMPSAKPIGEFVNEANLLA
ncbi:helix-turn-helix domain-containing protein [Natronoglycomyces albus]|uniref:Helix-turn-helix domain-containing protein n=1 Tax=Natronoglycomyces albus TaxID=2811108 RepID=A0A895XTD8_9ACTN|nr:helix-turn-helix transcriptional regulator [Natronoglycomyces albus]QSB06753.1 helix-turn-helix domain-containing protein [Natronoglycomyces albus]